MMHRRVYVRLVTLLALLTVARLEALADNAPAVRAARLTFCDGYVHVDRPENLVDNTAGDPAQLNMPLMEGQTIVTGNDGQAEVEFEDGSLARLTPNSSLILSHLAVDATGGFRTQMVLANGLAYFELRFAPRFTYTVAAGADRITPVENTTFRVNLDEAPAAIAVFDGTAHVERSGSYGTDLRAGESFRGDANAPGRYFLTQQILSDSWDQWNEARDQMAADAASQNTAVRNGYAGTQGYGWSDLDANGQWYDVPGQGQVWQPAGGDAADFDPYGNGSWVWYPSTGYVWASAYAWGWTPFRCGGWSYWDTFGWGWTPNAGCGIFGFAGFGYGSYGGYRGRLNVVLPPLHYIGHRPPPPGRGGLLHPVVAVHTGATGIRATQTAAGPPSAPRVIAGVAARPVVRVGASYTARGGSAVGSSLRRDFPVDAASHTPVLGVQPGQGATREGFVSGAAPSGGYVVNGRVAAPAYGARQGSGASPTTYGRPVAPQNGARAPQYSAPQYSAPRSAPPPAAAPRAPAPAPAAPSGGGVKK